MWVIAVIPLTVKYICLLHGICYVIRSHVRHSGNSLDSFALRTGRTSTGRPASNQPSQSDQYQHEPAEHTKMNALVTANFDKKSLSRLRDELDMDVSNATRRCWSTIFEAFFAGINRRMSPIKRHPHNDASTHNQMRIHYVRQ